MFESPPRLSSSEISRASVVGMSVDRVSVGGLFLWGSRSQTGGGIIYALSFPGQCMIYLFINGIGYE